MNSGLEHVLEGTARLMHPGLLEELLNVRHGPRAAELLAGVASRPLRDLVGRTGKRIRGRLVSLGFGLAAGELPHGEQAEQCRRLADAVEALHAGSLAIDDIEDGSSMRRGAPSLHVTYGVPIAVNLGTLLYYWAPETISSLGLDAERERRLLRLYNRTLVRAHLGQTIDVGIPIDTVPQADVPGVCLTSMELKSGALFAMSLLFGAVVAGADEGQTAKISGFGHGFGVGLQMFDDIGNIRGVCEPSKRWEDLALRRPTWIWACAARHFSPEIYGRFVSAVHAFSAHDPRPLETWFDRHDFLRRATRLAHDHVDSAFAAFERKADTAGHPALATLRSMGAEIARAYE